MGLFDHIDQNQLDQIEFVVRRNNRLLHALEHRLHVLERFLHPARPRPATKLTATLAFGGVNLHPAIAGSTGVITMSTATLTWVNPTARTDGTALAPADIASVDVFDSASPGPAIGSVKGGDTVTFTTDVIAVGDHTFTVVVNDTTGHKSAPSGGATLTVAATLSPPNVATSLAATLNPA